MLRLLPLPLLQRMRRRSASVDIIGRRQQVSDLPEYRHLKGERGHYAGDAERAAPRDKRQPRPRRPRHYYGLSEAQLTADERTRGYGELRASNPKPDPDSNLTLTLTLTRRAAGLVRRGEPAHPRHRPALLWA